MLAFNLTNSFLGKALKIASVCLISKYRSHILFMNPQNATEELLRRSQILLDELEIFKRHLEKRKRNQVEYRHFQSDIKTELKALKNLQHVFKSCDAQNESLALEVAQHALKSSNLSFMEVIWEVAKRSFDVVSLKRHGQAVDVVAEGGLLWIKVFNTTERRLLFEMVEEGWDWETQGDQDEDGSIPKAVINDFVTSINHNNSETPGPSGSEPGELNLTLLRVADTLVKLAKQTRVKYRHPRVLFVLPR